ncbi:hypothetical protein D3C71_1004330 [compost metagenome]
MASEATPAAPKRSMMFGVEPQPIGLTKPSGGGGAYDELIFRICATSVGSFGIQLPMRMRPPGRVTRTISRATSKGLGANMAPNMLMTRSKDLFSSRSSQASPSSNRQLADSPAWAARRLPAATRLAAMSTPSTCAPSLAAGMAVLPSPQPRSSTFMPGVMCACRTTSSPLSRMLSAMRVKSPFSQRALFGFMTSPSRSCGRSRACARVAG